MERYVARIPPGKQAVWLNGDNHKPKLKRKLTPSDSSSRNASVPLLPNKVEVVSLNAAPLPSPSFFQLLEDVSPHLQSVLLDKCTVLELSSLAVVSSSLREGALATMAKRSLDVHIRRFPRRAGRLLSSVYVMVMFIDDISDPSRNMSVEFCSCPRWKFKCQHWTKIQKLLLFCGHAKVKRIFQDEDCAETKSPNRFAMRSDHVAKYENHVGELSIEEFTSYSSECAKLLNLVTPRILYLAVDEDYVDEDDYAISSDIIKGVYETADVDYNDIQGFVPPKIEAVFNSRGMLSAEDINICFRYRYEYPVITDELMLKLTAKLIIFFSDVDPYSSYDLMINFMKWTPVGVSRFVEQWLVGSREIEKVVSRLPLPEYDSVDDDVDQQMEDEEDNSVEEDYDTPLEDHSVIKYQKTLVEALEKLDPAPRVVSSTALDDDLERQLNSMNEPLICKDKNTGKAVFYYKRDEAAVVRVTAPDGRKLTIALVEAWDVEGQCRTNTGFIDIFPSN